MRHTGRMRTVVVTWRPVGAQVLLRWAAERGDEVVLVETTKGRPSMRSDGWKSVVDLVPFGTTTVVAQRPADVAHIVEDAAPDLVVSFSYPHLIDDRTIAAAAVAALNVHPGRLPEFRGPNPLWAVYLGEPSIDISVHRLAPGFDVGDVLAVTPVVINEALSPRVLLDIFETHVPPTLNAAVERALAGESGDPQAEGTVNTRGLFTTADGDVSWDLTARELLCRWTACEFGGVAITLPVGAGRATVTALSIVSHAATDQPPGTVLSRLGRDAIVAVRDGLVLAEFVEPSGA